MWQYVPTLEKAILRSEPLTTTNKKGDVAVLYKTIGEVLLLAGLLYVLLLQGAFTWSPLAGHNDMAIPVLTKAINIFKGVTQIDCSGLIEGCNQLLMLAVQLSQKQQMSPQNPSQ